MILELREWPWLNEFEAKIEVENEVRSRDDEEVEKLNVNVSNQRDSLFIQENSEVDQIDEMTTIYANQSDLFVQHDG